MSTAEIIRLPRARGARRRQPSIALAAWREPLVKVTSVKYRTVVSEIEAFVIFDESRWPAARDGDAGCAIALALDHIYAGRPANIELAQMILSLLWVLACRGDRASQLTLEMLRSRLASISPQ